MGLLTPDTGTIIWTFIGFLIAFLILRKYAWKPILGALKERDNTIAGALKSAEKAKLEVSKLKSDNEKIMAEARQERDKVIREAREIKDDIINEARDLAKIESKKMVEEARETIKSEKEAAILELKNQIAELSVDIAEKILSHELSDPEKQKEMINKNLQDVKF